ncbi:hypothetical protein Q648_00199 [Bartonella quintana JK 12]|uniref:Uncharacterized protein n=2 Tax=Bartonella quintana TaxID=803 RepID=W3TWH6_BARQI|nr:hypothetical protein Q651_00304 [Bartonella quintana BQ2-D70]ETS13994.1 hypothetical protein Q650_00613 [Bartonella quintana JK 73rel]ETS15681.1 hypothetical protein Q649_00622 [Bartonella quintana JK 73]ETS16904.1 hypothetical protein Q648_01064 [Bartonella quintana JK 12]ETS17683.1 hypothetical protein Q647_00610 [Bartonella quintana JK 7]KEC58672.1 hypothetical protein O93_00947 [Bartonella quintana JK 19]KEC61984.1 hypothetical protein O91_00602 [Bartonella quintana JK 31]KEC62588.1 h
MQGLSAPLGVLAKIMMVPDWLLSKRTNYDGNL